MKCFYVMTRGEDVLHSNKAIDGKKNKITFLYVLLYLVSIVAYWIFLFPTKKKNIRHSNNNNHNNGINNNDNNNL